MNDKPKNLPNAQPNGEPLKPLTDVVLERRATAEFLPDEVPEEFLEAILKLGAQAPSGYNLQPWRFVVVREEENRKRLQAVAFNQPKVGQAPVVIIAVGMTREWKERADEVFREGAERGAGSLDTWEKYRDGAFQFLEGMQHMPTWVNRHTMIAYTVMMLAAEAYGFDTAPMEGFDAAAVKREFNVPEEGEVVALLAIGRAKGAEKVYPGRFGLSRIVYEERFGEAWEGNDEV
ncbi:MAG: nitroreductase family protein [Acidobacteria bacterium]|nr:nitroreductase family protein [Acidobacteriota bacterium]MCA1642876.1 nitroreductase family protein [Acidobacteriota bacterium]